MPDAVPLPLPHRPMRIRQTGIVSPIIHLVGIMFFVAIGLGMGRDSMSEIAKTWQISKDMVEVEDARMSDAKCKTSKFIMISCDAKISYVVDGRKFDKKISLLYLDIDSSPRSAAVVRSASDPSLATLDIAVDKIWHQIGSLLLMEAIILGFAVVILTGMVRVVRARRAILSLNGKMLRPIAVEVREITKNGYFSSTVEYQVPGHEGEAMKTLMGRKATPFFLDASPDNAMALAATDDQGKVVFLLDEKLQRLDFSKAERQALYEARAHQEKAAA